MTPLSIKTYTPINANQTPINDFHSEMIQTRNKPSITQIEEEILKILTCFTLLHEHEYMGTGDPFPGPNPQIHTVPMWGIR